MYYSQSSFKQDLRTTASNNGRSTSSQLLDKHFANSSTHGPGSRHANSSLPTAKTNGGGQPSDQEESITGMLNNFSKALGKLQEYLLFYLSFIETISLVYWRWCSPFSLRLNCDVQVTKDMNFICNDMENLSCFCSSLDQAY